MRAKRENRTTIDLIRVMQLGKKDFCFLLMTNNLPLGRSQAHTHVAHSFEVKMWKSKRKKSARKRRLHCLITWTFHLALGEYYFCMCSHTRCDVMMRRNHAETISSRFALNVRGVVAGQRARERVSEIVHISRRYFCTINRICCVCGSQCERERWFDDYQPRQRAVEAKFTREEKNEK